MPSTQGIEIVNNDYQNKGRKMTETKKEMQERLLYLQEKYEDVQADINSLNNKVQILGQRQIYLDKEITSLQLSV
jgi:peptidoglycan hydrolase CwlO-like protein